MIPYERPRGSVHDLEHLEELGTCRDRILCVSDRTLYLLHNLAAADITYAARYAIAKAKSGYLPPSREDPEWEVVQDIITNFQLEVLDMTCDIQAGLEAIAAALSANLGGTCTVAGNPVAGCLAGLTDEEILGPDDSSQGNPATDPPPDGFATWEEYFTYKCQAAHFIWSLERQHMVNLRNFEGAALAADILVPIVAGIAGFLPAMFTPAGFAIFIASILAIGVVAGASWFYLDEMIEDWDLNKDEIVCALYESGNSAQAVQALGNALEDAIQAIVSWGVLGPVAGEISGLLGSAFAQLAGNGIVAPLFQAVVSVSVPGADCSGCQEPGGECEGLRTFDADLENFIKINGDGTMVWDGIQGHDALGCAHIQIPGPGNGTVEAYLNTCDGFVIPAAWRCRFWIKIDGQDTTINVFMGLNFTDESQANTLIYHEDHDWLAVTVDTATHPEIVGKTLVSIRLLTNNGTGGQLLDVWFDDVYTGAFV